MSFRDTQTDTTPMQHCRGLVGTICKLCVFSYWLLMAAAGSWGAEKKGFLRLIQTDGGLGFQWFLDCTSALQATRFKKPLGDTVSESGHALVLVRRPRIVESSEEHPWRLRPPHAYVWNSLWWGPNRGLQLGRYS